MAEETPAAATKPADSAPQTKRIKVPVGIYGVEITEIEREVPLDEPPALPVNAELSVIGKSTARLDGHLKVTGKAKYTADIQLPGMLYGKLLRSPHPHANILSIDASAAAKYPGVRAVQILTRVLGTARESSEETKAESAWLSFDQKHLPKIKYVGQPVAAVAATSERAAAEAVKLIKVDYQLLPFVVDLDDAIKPDAPLVFPGPVEQDGTGGGGGAPKGLPQKGNIRGPETEGLMGGDRGNVDAGFAAADLIVEHEYRTQMHMHSALETHGLLVDWRDDGLTVYASTQGTSALRSDLASLFNLPKSKVRVITEFMGGGFGAKFGPGNHGLAAAYLSKMAKAPVKIMLDRKEEQTAAGQRPNSIQKLKVGAKKDGSLTAIKLESYGTAGAGLGAGVGWAAQSLYPCDNFASQHFDVLTHQSPACAFRAPGQPQGCFAVEQAMDELADKLKIDPLDLREKIDPNATRRAQRAAGAKHFGWVKRRPPGSDAGVIKTGYGVAQGEWPRFVSMDSSCEVRLSGDGSVEIFSSVQDIGTGIRTALAQIVAEELGLKPTDVTVHIGDTIFPTGPASGGSVTTGSISPAARKAAFKAKEKLFALASAKLGIDCDHLDIREGKIFSRDDKSKSVAWKELVDEIESEHVSFVASRPEDYGGFEKGRMGFGRLSSVQFVEVKVDTQTGRIFIERVVAVHSPGRPLNPLAIESQVNGGVIQGMSWALFEHRHVDKHTGTVINSNLESYKIAGAREIPKIEVLLLEEYLGRTNTDAHGIGEPAIVPVAAAIANAFYNATGVRLYEMPFTPARVLAALRKGGQD
jgi:xanthine dehydrogenase YagR molybdenum-binding subunit